MRGREEDRLLELLIAETEGDEGKVKEFDGPKFLGDVIKVKAEAKGRHCHSQI